MVSKHIIIISDQNQIKNTNQLFYMAIILYNITVFTVLCDNMNGMYIYFLLL